MRRRLLVTMVVGSVLPACTALFSFDGGAHDSGPSSLADASEDGRDSGPSLGQDAGEARDASVVAPDAALDRCLAGGSSTITFEVIQGSDFLWPLDQGSGEWTYNVPAGSAPETVFQWTLPALEQGCAFTRLTLSLPEGVPVDPDVGDGCRLPGRDCATHRTRGVTYEVLADRENITENVVDQGDPFSIPSVDLAFPAGLARGFVQLSDVSVEPVAGEAFIVVHDLTAAWE